MLLASSVFLAFNFAGGERVCRVVTARGKVNQNGDERGEAGKEGRTKSWQCSTPLTPVILGD